VNNNFKLCSKSIAYEYDLAPHLLEFCSWRCWRNSLSNKIISSSQAPTAGHRFVNAIIVGL
jgi:hypothetical protein